MGSGLYTHPLRFDLDTVENTPALIGRRHLYIDPFERPAPATLRSESPPPVSTQ